MNRCGCNSVFSKPSPIGIDVTINKCDIVEKASNILNKMAEARYDGQNAQYVNNMQPEVDICQDREIICGFVDDGIARIVKRIEPYVVDYNFEDENEDPEVRTATLYLQFPTNWKRQFEAVLRKRIEDYLVYMIIAHWLEKVSIADTQYSMEKSEDLLYELRNTCDLRQGMVHRSWNTTY